MPKLYVLTDGQTALATGLTEEHFTIGRGDDNSLALDDRSVSKYHAMLIAHGADYKLVDLNSRNGTFLNGQRVMEEMLKNGDEIRVGILELRYEGPATRASQPPIRPAVSRTPTPTETGTTSPGPRALLRQSAPVPEIQASSAAPTPVAAPPIVPASQATSPQPVKPPIISVPPAQPAATPRPPVPPPAELPTTEPPASAPYEPPKTRTLLTKPAVVPQGEIRIGGPRKPIDAPIKKHGSPPKDA